MNHQEQILLQHLSEQIALEEQLCSTLKQQLAGIHDPELDDTKSFLAKICETLGSHYEPLNKMLDKLEKQELLRLPTQFTNGTDQRALEGATPAVISKMLRDDYSALNQITMANTILHTAALALEQQEIAVLALQHLENLTPLTVKLGELVAEIAAHELHSDSPEQARLIAKAAIENARSAWRKAG